MASSSSSNLPRLFILAILISIFSLPVLHARDMQFFSKASHTTTTGNQPATTTNNEPSISTSEQAIDDQQSGYGLYGHGNNAAEEETYQYSPTTKNPTVAAGKRSTNNNNDAFQMDSYSSVNEGGNIGNRWTGQGISDRTRRADDGSFETEKMMNEQQRKRQPRFSAEGEIERGSHGEIYYNNKNSKQQSGGGDALRKSFYGTVDRQGMSDTRYLENGKYYYDVSREEDEEKKNKYDDNTITNTNSRGFDSTDDDEAVSYEAEDVGDNDEEEDGHDRIYQYENNKYSHDGKQGMSDTRYFANGRYFYDINKEKQQVNNKNNDNEEVVQQQQGFENDKSNNRRSNEYHHTVNQNENRGEQDGYKSNAARFDFRNTVNKFPKYEFDSMEEYMKQNGYYP